jgi:alpha-L-fucosidase
VSRLEEIAAWMKINADAIHGTRPMPPYKAGNVAFTRKGNSVFAIYVASADESTVPASVLVPQVQPAAGSTVQLLGSRARLSWEKSQNGIRIDVPDANRAAPARHAFVFKIDT